MLGSFGGSYKKTQALKTTQKCQELVVKNAGLDECNKLWQAIFGLFKHPVVSADADADKYLQNVLAATWLWGYESLGTSLTLPPNGLGYFRVLCPGR